MLTFGEMLRSFRQQCNDPGNTTRKLSQERLGELLGMELHDHGYSGAAVSDWERGVSKIHADQRQVLTSLIKVLHEWGGIKTLQEANQLLESGNYRALNNDEKQQVLLQDLLESPVHSPITHIDEQKPVFRYPFGNTLLRLSEKFQSLLDEAKEGPPPVWPRVVTAILRRLSDQISPLNTLRTLLWLCIWIACYIITSPVLHWPFPNQEMVSTAITLYICGSLVLPLCIGVLANTKNNPFWQQNEEASPRMIRLYTYQGAFIGFHLGYFIIFAVHLFLFFFEITPVMWFQFLLMGFPLLMGYISAQIIPYSLFSAYKRLWFSDGAIFFMFVFLGPLWGLFLLRFYQFVLDLIVGPFIILLAIIILVILMARRKRQTNSTVIPVHWWVMIYGSVAILYQISISRNLYSVVSLTALIVALSALLGLGRIQITLPGALMGLAAIGLLVFAFQLGSWIGALAAGFILLIWWFWGKKHLSLPWSFWIVILINIGCGWLYQQKLLSDTWASIAFGDVTLLLLWAEHRVLNTTRLS